MAHRRLTIGRSQGKDRNVKETVVAFANGNGGKIIFGIDDKTLEIVGMVIVVEILPGAMRPYYIKSKGMSEGLYKSVRNYKTCRRIYVERTDFGRTEQIF